MKFFNYTFVVSVLLAIAIWFYWKTPPQLFHLSEVAPVDESAVSKIIDPEQWSKRAFKPDPTKDNRSTPASYYLRDWPPLKIEDYDIIKVTLDDQEHYYRVSQFAEQSIWRADRIPEYEKFPYRSVTLFLLGCVVLLSIFKKVVFRKPPTLVAYTSVGSGYRIAQALCLWGGLLLLLPWTYKIQDNLFGAAGVVGSILFLTGLISFTIYARSSKKLENQFSLEQDQVLADWMVPRAQWLEFVKQRSSKGIKTLILVLSAITVFAVFSAHIASYGERNAGYVMVTITAICVLIWLATVLPALWMRHVLLHAARRVRVYSFGVLLGDRIHIWQQPNCVYAGAVFDETPLPHMSVHFTSMILTNGGLIPQQGQIAFPVPMDERERACEIVEKLNQSNTEEVKPGDELPAK